MALEGSQKKHKTLKITFNLFSRENVIEMVVDGQEAPVVEGAAVEQQVNPPEEVKPAAPAKTGKMIDDGNVGNSAKMFVGGKFSEF